MSEFFRPPDEEFVMAIDATSLLPNAASIDPEIVRKQLRSTGYVLIRDASEDDTDRVIESLGTVVDETDVTPDDATDNLVTDRDELPPHTDHGGVDTILWRCRTQAQKGGQSILVDAKAAYEQLSEADQQALENVYMTEHQVFPDDPSKRPLVRRDDGRLKFYYSFWLLEDELSDRAARALDAFRAAVREVEAVTLRLRPGDVLIVDNTRMLHGRTAIETGDRMLERYWLRQDVPDDASENASRETMRRDDVFEMPEEISQQRIAELEQRGIDPEVARIDLSMVKMKLQDSDEGKGWSADKCERVEVEYKRYLTLNRRFEDRAIVPTSEIDDMWHYHILDTRAYAKDCEAVFGEYFHHFPYFGMRGSQDEANLKSSFEETTDLYEEVFGEPMLREVESSDCWHDCKGRCWHACSSNTT